jgi:hypothetical protein
LASATAAAPLVGLDDPTGQHSTTGFELLTDGLEAQLVKAAEHSQVSTGEAVVSGILGHPTASTEETSVSSSPRHEPIGVNEHPRRVSDAEGRRLSDDLGSFLRSDGCLLFVIGGEVGLYPAGAH